MLKIYDTELNEYVEFSLALFSKRERLSMELPRKKIKRERL